MQLSSSRRKMQEEFWQVSAEEDTAKAKILTDNGVQMGEVTADMLSGMQKLTEPMLGEFIESVGEKAGRNY